MWNRAFIRLLSLSFTAFFVVALLWREERPPNDAAKGKQPAHKEGEADPREQEGR